jgi:hypothetical protein
VPTAQSVNCVTRDPGTAGPEMAALDWPAANPHGLVADTSAAKLPVAPVYKKFTSQDELGHFLLVHYKIKTPRQITSCDTCHR